MPRTVFVFLNEEPRLTPEARRRAAEDEARAALGAYWTALEGTLDPKKVEGAADNALVGNAEDVAQQILKRFHPDDRLMLWFDFFNHDSARVIRNMEAFRRLVAPRIVEGLGR
jgi:alkanesulfonate monooxygenase SsuD/methylene tetrahydromethanopterin reductase-like flavin-dependent oxidoreductase (luciferase family)